MDHHCLRGKEGLNIHFGEGQVDCGGKEGWSDCYTNCALVSQLSRHCPDDPVLTNLHQEPGERKRVLPQQYSPNIADYLSNTAPSHGNAKGECSPSFS